jgi:hypothetical protein
MFQFTGFASTRLWIQRRNIREPRDQRSFVSSPGLIADFHALHRLLMPRHPPCALNSLTTNIHCSWTPASPLQVALFSFLDRPTGICTRPRRPHSSEDAIYARTTKLSKIIESSREPQPPRQLSASRCQEALQSIGRLRGCQPLPREFLRTFPRPRKCPLNDLPSHPGTTR